jgi:rRNA maturation endonuclease Nob1
MTSAGIYRCTACRTLWHMRRGHCPRCGSVCIPSAVSGGDVVEEG